MKAWLKQTRWYQKLLLVLVGLYLAYLILAPLLAAFWGRAKLVDEVTALTGKQVQLGGLYFNPLTNSVTLKDFAIADNGSSLIRFDRFFADLELGPLLDHQVYLRQVTLAGPQVRLVRLKDGVHVNLQSLVQPQPAETEPAPTAEPGEPLAVVIANLEVSNGQLEVVDESLPKPASLAISKINFRTHDLQLTSSQAAPFQLALDFPQGGHLAIDGKLALAPLAVSADIKLTQLSLPLGNPWLASVIQGQVASGQLETQLALTLAGDAVLVTGGAQVEKLQLDNADGAQLLALDQLAATGLDLDTGTRKLALDSISLDGLTSRFEIYADGKTSIDRLLPAAPAAPETKSKPAAEASDAAPWQVALGQFTLNARELVFNDHSVKPAYQLAAKPLQLTLGPLDSSSAKAASLDLSAKLGGYAPLSVKGSVNVFAKRPDTSLAVRFKGYDMTNLTPYTGTFVGYQVDKGQLGVSTDVQLKGSLLTSRSTIDASNFYLGNKVDSKDAIKAPVKFGLSILRDGKGDISLPLAVSGDLSDPSVSVHGLVLKALLNVLTKAATAPLAALSLLSGGVDLEKVPFAAGSASVDDAQLEPLAKVLTQRPALTLGLSGSCSDEDAAALTAKGETGKALADALSALANARASALKLALIEHHGISADRLYLQQPQAQGKLAGVALSAISK